MQKPKINFSTLLEKHHAFISEQAAYAQMLGKIKYIAIDEEKE
jgi:hypothetical protein